MWIRQRGCPNFATARDSRRCCPRKSGRTYDSSFPGTKGRERPFRGTQGRSLTTRRLGAGRLQVDFGVDLSTRGDWDTDGTIRVKSTVVGDDVIVEVH